MRLNLTTERLRLKKTKSIKHIVVRLPKDGDIPKWNRRFLPLLEGRDDQPAGGGQFSKVYRP